MLNEKRHKCVHEDTSATLKFNIYFFPICVQNGFNKNGIKKEKHKTPNRKIAYRPEKNCFICYKIHVEFKFCTGSLSSIMANG